MSDRAGITAKCPNFKYVKKNSLYCAGADEPIVFDSRDKLSEYLRRRCNNPNNGCSLNSLRSRCCMEVINAAGARRCSGYNIECHRATCKYYKSEHDKAVAEVRTKERLLSLPDETRNYIEQHYYKK